jgi:hypothetical protein
MRKENCTITMEVLHSLIHQCHIYIYVSISLTPHICAYEFPHLKLFFEKFLFCCQENFEGNAWRWRSCGRKDADTWLIYIHKCLKIWWAVWKKIWNRSVWDCFGWFFWFWLVFWIILDIEADLLDYCWHWGLILGYCVIRNPNWHLDSLIILIVL